MHKLYENIRKLRIEKGMSQTELAKLAGYTDRSSIAKIEKGVVDLTQSKIKTFADIFNISPIELMGMDDQEETYYIDSEARDYAEFLFKNPEYRLLFSACRNVKKEDLEFVKQMIDRMNKD